MPHKCTKCGREYKDGSTEILKGCASCGNKKFIYVKESDINKDVYEEKSIEELAGESAEDVLEVAEPEIKKEPKQEAPAAAAAEVKADVKGKARKETGMFDRVETIRIVGPGSYELNIDKMAKSDERIVSVGGEEGSYIIDLMSMAKDDTKPKRSKRR
ncbi:Zn-ribbon domain-containing protein [Methanoregula sp. UBA64]|uniref:Zn-ribbon domain-containing protein n=1 Tax=Methanoregula sp. UBA64 TaxID=1915554 RepID=UPI0025E353C4|nr:Zn-ribbon domain-containing protein [Methanoregula sp. UBA64]